MFALVDANSFYCSAEQVFRPDWRGKPVIVLSNNDGCVVAANKQAKAAGVEKFKPYFEVRDLCRKRGVIALSSNYELYGDLSSKMMQIIGRFAPEQHIYSIDETFLSFHRAWPAVKNLREQGRQIRKAVWKEARLPVCVGIGPTLTLAKAANHAAKKIQGFDGVCVIDTETERLNVLANMDVGDVWGIGRKLTKKLHIMDICNAKKLAAMPPGLARKNFSIEMERTVRELNGIPCKGWDEARADKQQINSTRSVGERITDIQSLHQALAKHVGIAAAKLRAQGSVCGVMFAFANNSPFDEQPAGFKQVIRFPVPIDDTAVMTSAVSRVVPQLYRPGIRYYKIGIGLLDLSPASKTQLDLFNQTPGDSRLMSALDSLNYRYGTDTLFLAAQGIQQKWTMRRELLTPQYTTDWHHIPKIHC
ncbi:Y-family DNA polymerase [Shewanella sp. A32]|uniref:Y-family DNA polymerase n=1 Tax=Shewanella sp. A32 TaxID=3031327 RepID=UPI0023B944D7|nr:Y-family DNA polymerase [Shewanella sp. A32]MDF0533677.1 Y-family DNA polymerase [Shewanella sp. A32]